ncbi:glycosyltransferase family 2 protein [Tepidamorphus sp. 3E244]|uniref:glycosyltransferase family 2 protein n=1 Tax=Tepidamorphus sp. 3E244 TaxID=3385498 RepID=UPI0038FCCD8D
MLPSVAIVIPTFNRAHILPQAIEAALGQSHPDTTVFVIDDGSSDDTGDVISRFADHPRFVGVRLAQNVGTAQAKNVGIWLSATPTTSACDGLPNGSPRVGVFRGCLAARSGGACRRRSRGPRARECCALRPPTTASSRRVPSQPTDRR